MHSTTTRFFFEDMASAIDGLITVIEDARETSSHYSFGSLSAQQVLSSGLLLVGEIDDVAEKLDALEGTTRHDE